MSWKQWRRELSQLYTIFAGASAVYPREYLFNTIPEAVSMVEREWDSNKYRKFIEDQYAMNKTKGFIREEIKKVEEIESKEPKVSVVVTVYNREKYVKEALESIINQSYKKIEIIVINDGSTDGSEEIIQSFKDSRIQYYYKENTGQLDSLKYGLEKCQGKYITRVDSDDKIEKEYLELCVREMEKDPNLQFVYTNFTLIDEKGKTKEIVNFHEYKNAYKIIEDLFNGFSSVIPDVCMWHKEYIKRVIQNYTIKNMPFYIDSILNCKFKRIDKALYEYRQHSSNFAANAENFRFVIQGKICFLDYIIRRYFIMMDINGDFRENREKYYTLFIKRYVSLAESYCKIDEKIAEEFLQEAKYWAVRRKEAVGGEEGDMEKQITMLISKMNSKEKQYEYKNESMLIVSTDDPHDGNAIGGKHVHIHLLQKGLSKLSVENTLFAYEHNPNIKVNIAEVKKAFGLEQQEVEKWEDNGFLYLVYAIQRQLEEKIERKLKESYVSAINCQDVIAVMAAYNVIQRLKYNVPVLATLHGYFTYENTDYGYLHKGSSVYEYFLKYEREACNVCSHIITVDTRIKKYVSELLGAEDSVKITVLQNAIDEKTFSVEVSHRAAFSENVFIVPRRLVPKNGVIYAVEAAHALLKENIDNFKMLLLGDGIEREKIQRYIKENQLEQHIEVLGSIPHNEVLQYFNRAKGVIIPSIPSSEVEEATSLAALEGMACQKIVVASNIGGLKEIIKHGENGYLVTPKVVEELKEALEKIINMDWQEYVRIGKMRDTLLN